MSLFVTLSKTTLMTISSQNMPTVSAEPNVVY